MIAGDSSDAAIAKSALGVGSRGAGNPRLCAYPLNISCASVPDVPEIPFDCIRSDAASIALGVFSSPANRGSYLTCDSRLPYFVPFLYPFTHTLSLIRSGSSQVITAVGVSIMGEDEDSVASVGCADSRSRNKHRLDGISEAFKVTADAFDGEGLLEFVSVKLVTLLE